MFMGLGYLPGQVPLRRHSLLEYRSADLRDRPELLRACTLFVDNDNSESLGQSELEVKSMLHASYLKLAGHMIAARKSFPHHVMAPKSSAAQRSESFRRNTQQRREIREVFERTDRPLAADEVLQLAQEKMAGLEIATVYRAIKALTNEGWLVLVAIPGASPRYEIRGKAHHHHFHCLKCDRLFELKACVAHLGKMIPPTFQMIDHVVLIDGFCTECRRGRKVQRTATRRNSSMRATI
jgi:Fur family ferric uptake transcriptional regulator